MNKNKFTFSLSSSFMVSTNDAYFHVAYKRKGSNRMTTHAVKSEELKAMQESFIPSIEKLIDDSFINECIKMLRTGMYGLSICTDYYMPLSNYKSSDVSNYIKVYEDCISYALKKHDKILDDKNNLEYLSHKFCNPGDLWRIVTTISIVKRDECFINNLSEDLSNQFPKICPMCNNPLIILDDGNRKCDSCDIIYKIVKDEEGEENNG